MQNRNVPMQTFCNEFDLTKDEAIDDLSLLTYVGPGKFGGELVDIQYDEESIKVIDSQGLDKPLRFNSMEASLILLGVKHLIENSENPVIAKQVETKLIDLIDDKTLTREVYDYTKFLEIMHSAIENKNSVKIDYVNSNLGARSDRIVLPKKISNIEGKDYFDALDQFDGKVKTFRFERLINAEIFNDSIDYSEVYEASLRKRNQVKLIGKPWFRSRILDLAIPFTIDENELVIDMDFYDVNYLLDLILRLGSGVKIEADDEIKNQLRQALQTRIERLS